MKCLLTNLFTLIFASVSYAAPANVNADGVSIDGYDAVSYFLLDEAVRGSEEFQLSWNDVTWWFSSEENLSLFESNPDQYAPRFAGHCANGLSDGHLVSAKPQIYRIIDGRLYLFYSWWGKAQWKYDQESQIKLAEKYWKEFSN